MAKSEESSGKRRFRRSGGEPRDAKRDAGPPIFVPPPPDVVARIRELYETPLSAEEFEARVQSPITPDEEAGGLELIRWFLRRYPKPDDRLAYARRAYERLRSWLPR